MKKNPVYIAATGQHAGKTTLALGLLNAFRQRDLRTAFIKPVGQRYMEVNGDRIDEDAVLVRDTFHSSTSLVDMSPVAIPRGFTEDYIRHRNKAELHARIKAAYQHLCADADAVIVEGTGHAGVGSVFDTSNADVAAMLGASVIIVSEGGVGRPIDEICLNRALFARKGVPILGIVLNKVLAEKYDRITEIARLGLDALGLRLLGAIPFDPILTFPTMRQLARELNARVLAGEEHLNNVVENTVIAAMEPQNVIAHIQEKTLVITPGDRIDNILVAISSHLISGGTGPHISGILLTGGLVPHFTIVSLLKRSQIPVLLSDDPTFAVSTSVTDMVFKINPDDTAKIADVQDLVGRHIDLDVVLDSL